MKSRWFVWEAHSGFVDGFYYQRESAQRAMEGMHEQRPDYTHLVGQMVSIKEGAAPGQKLPDYLFWRRAVDMTTPGIAAEKRVHFSGTPGDILRAMPPQAITACLFYVQDHGVAALDALLRDPDWASLLAQHTLKKWAEAEDGAHLTLVT
jgi:hypothetical protein